MTRKIPRDPRSREAKRASAMLLVAATTVFAEARRVEVRSSRECTEIPKEMQDPCKAHKGASSSFWYARFEFVEDCAVLEDSLGRSACVASTSQGDLHLAAIGALTKSEANAIASSRHYSQASRNRDVAVVAVVGLLAGIVGGSLLALHFVLTP